MTQALGTADLLRRLAAREGVPGAIPAMTPLRALRVALKKSGQQVPAAGLRLAALYERRVSLAEFGDMLEARAALFRLGGPPDSAGLLAIDAPVVHAIAAVRTTGSLPREGLPDRGATQIDSVISMPFLAQLLVEFVSALDGLEAERLMTGYRIGGFLADRTSALLDLEDVPYRLFAGTVTAGDGAGTGKISFLVPADPPRLRQAQPLSANDAEWQRRLHIGVMKAEAVLEARLAPLQFDIKMLRSLKPGSELALPAEALTKVQLVSSEGRTLATGRLGQLSGNRALRVSLVGG